MKVVIKKLKSLGYTVLVVKLLYRIVVFIADSFCIMCHLP